MAANVNQRTPPDQTKAVPRVAEIDTLRQHDPQMQQRLTVPIGNFSYWFHL